ARRFPRFSSSCATRRTIRLSFRWLPKAPICGRARGPTDAKPLERRSALDRTETARLPGFGSYETARGDLCGPVIGPAAPRTRTTFEAAGVVDARTRTRAKPLVGRAAPASGTFFETASFA